MQTKLIDCKMKEIYYTPINIQEDKEITDYRNGFWNSMNNYGLQIRSMVELKIA